VSAPALAACVACSTPAAVEEAAAWASGLETRRDALADSLDELPGIDVVPEPSASFLLLRTPLGLREDLRRQGFAVRRGDTFPGLGAEWLRIAVRDEQTSADFTAAVEGCL
jgi:histidinol-phosphate aminotransferase